MSIDFFSSGEGDKIVVVGEVRFHKRHMINGRWEYVTAVSVQLSIFLILVNIIFTCCLYI